MSRCLFKILLFLAAGIFLDRFCHEQTGTFSLYKTQVNRPDDPTLRIDRQPSPELFLHQSYRFIGHGNESFVFLSEDGNTVLKLFKLQLLRPAYFKSALKEPFYHFKENLIFFRKERLLRTFNSIAIAHKDLQEETALLYIHLAPVPVAPHRLTIIDKIGIAHHISLDTTKFILQKKADLVYPTLERLMEEGNLPEAKKRINSLLDLIKKRCAKGIADRDARIEANFGFIGPQAIELDVGSFSYDPSVKDPEKQREILLTETAGLKKWLSKYPLLLEYLEIQLSF